jgi:HD-GYP domain-containing protein (c-di-GMP phosphodiesterase class II)
MATQVKIEKLRSFYRNFCISFVGSVQALNLYPPDHPGTKKKVSNVFQHLRKYFNQRPTLTLLVYDGDVIVENFPLPELSKVLTQFIQHMQAMKFHRLVFLRGLSSDELLLFLQSLLRCTKKPAQALEVMEKNQKKLPHILASPLPADSEAQLSYEDLSDTLRTARKSILSFSDKLKTLYTDIEGSLSETKVAMAKETTKTIYEMNMAGQIPLKVLIYRRSTDDDPYTHAINVCALSMALAREIELGKSVVKEVGLAGLFHDIGLHLSSPKSLSEAGAIPLYEKKRQWKHPIRGARILLATPGIPSLVPLASYEHHIHYDGGGYPKQKRPGDLNLASMIIGITDRYDNLRRNRPGRDAMSLTSTMNWMDRRLGSHFHPILFKKFRGLVKAQAKDEVT